MNDSDKILNLLKDGDKRGLEKLFRKFYKPLVMYAMRYVPRQEEAEDIVQEVFIKFWENSRFAEIELYLRSYLYQSVRNRCLNYLETVKISRVELTESDYEFIEEEMPNDIEWNAKIDEIYRAIDELPPRSREIFIAIVLGGKRYKEVAEELDISVNTVKTTLSRTLSTLRTNLSGGAYALFLALL